MPKQPRKAQVITRFGQTCRIYDAEKGVLDCFIKKNIPYPPVTGDWVHWQENEKIICHVEERISILERKDKTGRCKPLAANIDQIFIVSAFSEPAMSESIIDGYLVVAENENMNPVLVFNKQDLAHKEKSLRERYQPYQALGYTIIECSTGTQHGVDNLLQLLKQKTSILVGQSGVGKSSIINQILPLENIATLPLSEGILKGQHTTTASTLYTIPDNGKLVDSPGIRRFTPFIRDKDYLNKGFKEINALSEKCQFSNCSHLKEENCAVKQALDHNQISTVRFNNYLYLFNEIEANKS